MCARRYRPRPYVSFDPRSAEGFSAPYHINTSEGGFRPVTASASLVDASFSRRTIAAWAVPVIREKRLCHVILPTAMMIKLTWRLWLVALYDHNCQCSIAPWQCMYCRWRPLQLGNDPTKWRHWRREDDRLKAAFSQGDDNDTLRRYVKKM